MKNKEGDATNIAPNQFDLLTGNQKGLSAFYYAEKQADWQSILLAEMKRHNKVIRLFHCFGCEKKFAARKMSNCLVVCRTCYQTAQEKGKIAKQNFVERTMNNFHKFLRRRVAV